LLSRSHDSGEPFSAEYRLLAQDGRPVWFHDEAVVVRDAEGNPLFLHGIMLEIDERKQAEENLHRYAMHLMLLNELGQQIAAELENERLLTQAVYLIHVGFGYHHVGLFLLDQAQQELIMLACAGSYVHLFPSDLHLALGEGMVGWVGQHGKQLLANDVRQDERYYNPFPDAIATQSELAVPIRSGGEVVGVLDVQSPDLDAFDQDDIIVLETLADQIAVAIKNARLYAALAQERATLAQRVEERTAELSLANAELARAARLKDEFLANMSHELRTPLNAILGLSEAVAEGVYGPLTERQTKSLDSIGQAGQHLLSLVNDILDVAKAEAGKLTLQIDTVSVHDLCQASLNLVRQMAHQKGIQPALTIDEQVKSVQADQRRLKQV
jgi:signal transduction histidine kinase